MSTIPLVREDQDEDEEEEGREHVRQVDEWTEVTSSGLTHTCADNFLNKLLCPLMINTFSSHRQDNSPNRRAHRDWWTGDLVGASIDGVWQPNFHINAGAFVRAFGSISKFLHIQSSSNLNLLSFLSDGYYIGSNAGSLSFDSKHLNISVFDLGSGSLRLFKSKANSVHPDAPPRLPLVHPDIPDFYRFPRDGKPWQIILSLLVAQVVIIYSFYKMIYFVSPLFRWVYRKIMKKPLLYIWECYCNTIFYSETLFGVQYSPEQRHLLRKAHLKLKRKMRKKQIKKKLPIEDLGLSSEDEETLNIYGELSSDSSDSESSMSESNSDDFDMDTIRPEEDGELPPEYRNQKEKLDRSTARKISKSKMDAFTKLVGKYDKNAVYRTTANGGLMKVTAVPEKGKDTISLRYRFLPSAAEIARQLDEQQRQEQEKETIMKNEEEQGMTDMEDSDTPKSRRPAERA